MITIADILLPRQLSLELAATTPAGAIHETAQRLRGNEKVIDWNGFVAALKTGSSCVSNENGYGICIPHARTHCVSSMVMAASRSNQGIFFPDEGVLVHYIFVIGVPVAMASDYLRIIGALARTFRSPRSEAVLRDAATKQDFISLLSASETPV